MDFDLNEEQRLLKDSVDRLTATEYTFEKRKGYAASADRLEPRAVERSMPNSGCWPCRSRRPTAASAAAQPRS